MAILVVGPTKAGSSWVWEVLKRLDCNMPVYEKELFFFDHEIENRKDWYLKQFAVANDDYCDVSPTLFRKYLYAEPRISEVFEDCTIIILVRDPVQRAISDYFHFVKTGRCKLGLKDAIAKFPEILQQSQYSVYVPLWAEKE